MFSDARSKQVIWMAHCILNQNSISDGTADYPGPIQEIMEYLSCSRIGIVQMPCPELHCLGLDRGDPRGCERPVVIENTRIRTALDRSASRRILKRLVDSVIFQMEEYRRYGFTLVGIVGVNRSPSCGVETTSKKDREVRGKGLFIGALHRELEKRHLRIETIGIKTGEMSRSLKKLRALVDGYRSEENPTTNLNP